MTLPISTDAAPPPRAGIAVRIAAGVAALLILLVSGRYTLGLSLVAPFGMFVGRRWMRRRGRAFTGFASWISAYAASSIAFIVGFVVVLALIPDTTWQEIREARAQAEVQDTQPPPDWARPDPATEMIMSSRPVTIALSLAGALFAAFLFGAIAGTAGWGGMLLLSYAVRGHGAAWRTPGTGVAR